MGWRCVSFESPGVPHAYMQAALRQRPEPGAWDEAITGYLAAPNPINMLYPHLGECCAHAGVRRFLRACVCVCVRVR